MPSALALTSSYWLRSKANCIFSISVSRNNGRMSRAKLGMVTAQRTVRISTDTDGADALRSRDMEGNGFVHRRSAQRRRARRTGGWFQSGAEQGALVVLPAREHLQRAADPSPGHRRRASVRQRVF